MREVLDTGMLENVTWNCPYTLRNRPYIPLEESEIDSEFEYHLLETRRRMRNCSIFSFDVDGFITRVSPSPVSKDGTLDAERIHKLSPYTMPILERLGKYSAYIPITPNSGKSYMVKQTLYNQIEKIKFGYLASQGAGSINDQGLFIPHPAFVEPITGRMRALDTNGFGKPSAKLLLFGVKLYDNGGGREDTMHPDGHSYREKFPFEFFDHYTNLEFQELLVRTTRQEKMTQQIVVMKDHVLFSDAKVRQRYPNGLPATSMDYDTEYIRTGLIAAKVSYGSRYCKFNLDLDMEKIKSDSQLQKGWESFFGRHGVEMSSIRTFTDFQAKLVQYFSGVATVSSNYVPGNPDSGMGDRMAIDFAPPKINKEIGLMKAIEYIKKEYSRAKMAYPSFMEHDAIAGGDGAHRDLNDWDLIFSERGVTNTLNLNYPNVDGFPTHFLDLFQIYGITVAKPLDYIEQTLVFSQLLLHSRLGFPINDLPQETLAKLEFH